MASDLYRYPDDILRKLQKVELDMLKVFDIVCKKYDLVYFAVWGTAIGAMRHNGFIPWDDDIDVGMMIEDYKKLLQIPKDVWKSYGLELYSPQDDCPYHMLTYACLYKTGTRFVKQKTIAYSKPRKDKNLLNRPIFLDIQIYSRVKDYETAEKESKRIYKLKRMWYYSLDGMRAVSSDSVRFKLRCYRNDLIHKTLNIIARPDRKLFNKIFQIIENLDQHGNYITTFSTGILEEMKKSVLPEDDMFPVKYVPFEDTEIPVVNNVDKMLKQIYGDYMKLPPEDKRFNHGPQILDFGDGRGNVIPQDRSEESV